MSLSRRLRMPILGLAVVMITALGVAVPGSAASPTASGTHAAAAARASDYTSRVVGTFGRAGTVRGHFVPVRSWVRRGVTYVQGDMSVTLRRASGALVGRTHRHDVALPVHASGAHSTAMAAGTQAAAAS